MRFGLLGSLVATRDDGKSIPLPAGKPRVVLTALLLCPNVVVGVDRLIDAVWEEQPPDSARQTIQFFVHKLRKALVSAGELGDAVVSTEAGGYLVRVASDALDVSTFERLVARARFELDDSRPSEAAQTFAAALALWRGPALAEVAEARFAQPIIGRLDELRVAALEDLAEARLALGQHAQLVPELEALVRAHPVRERLRGQLILALYRSQRQAEALQAYRDLRRRFAGELGVEPSPDLRRLEQAILRQDPELDVPHRTTARPSLLTQRPNLILYWGVQRRPLANNHSSPRLRRRPGQGRRRALPEPPQQARLPSLCVGW